MLKQRWICSKVPVTWPLCFLLLQERMDVEMASGKFTGKTALFYWVSRNKRQQNKVRYLKELRVNSINSITNTLNAEKRKLSKLLLVLALRFIAVQAFQINHMRSNALEKFWIKRRKTQIIIITNIDQNKY